MFSLQHKTISIHIKESQFLTKCHNGAPLCCKNSAVAVGVFIYCYSRVLGMPTIWNSSRRNYDPGSRKTLHRGYCANYRGYCLIVQEVERVAPSSHSSGMYQG